MFYILLDRSIELWKQQIEVILRHHGLISFIVHPDYITRPTECEQYKELLEHIRGLDTEGTLPVVKMPTSVDRLVMQGRTKPR